MIKKNDNSFSLDFLTGAVWAASLLIRYKGDTQAAKSLLDVIPDVKSAIENSLEKDVFQLRLYVNNDLPLGKHPEYLSLGAAPLDPTSAIVDVAEDELVQFEAAPGDALTFCVYGVLPDMEKVILIDNIFDPEVAIKHLHSLRTQL